MAIGNNELAGCDSSTHWHSDDDLRRRLDAEQDEYDQQMAAIRAEADACLLDLAERLQQGVQSEASESD